MSDSSDDVFGGFLIGIMLIAVIGLFFYLGFLSGGRSVENDCQHYGKYVDGQEIYICEKQK